MIPVTPTDPKHGLASAFSVLPNEDQAEFDSLLAGYREEFVPDGHHESFLVDQMAHARWKLARLQRLEAQMFEKEDWKTLSAMQRYSASTERSYYKAYRELLFGRKELKKAEEQAMEQAISAYVNAPMPGQRISTVPPIRPMPVAKPAAGNLALRL